MKKGVLFEILQNSQENTCALVFSCKFCEILKNTYFKEHLWAIAFESD